MRTLLGVLLSLLTGVAAAQQPVLLELKGPKRPTATAAVALTAALTEQGYAPVRVRMPASPRPAQVRTALNKAHATAWVRATVQRKAVQLEVFNAEGARVARLQWKLPRAGPTRVLPASVAEALIAALPSAGPPNYLATLARERAARSNPVPPAPGETPAPLASASPPPGAASPPSGTASPPSGTASAPSGTASASLASASAPLGTDSSPEAALRAGSAIRSDVALQVPSRIDSPGESSPAPSELAASAPPTARTSTGEPAPTVLELMVGGSVFSRQLSYVDDLFEALASYRLPVGPAWAVEGNLFPGAWSGWLPELGLVGEVKRSALVYSREADGTAFPTEHLSLQAGLVYRRELGPFELRGLVSLINDRFELRASADGTPAPRVPAVNYLGPRVAGEARLRFLSVITAALLVGYRQPFAVGELGAPDYFPRLSGGGLEGAASLHWAFTPALGLQASFQYRRYFWAMNSRPGDPLVAGGALDQYLLGSVGVTVWLR